MTLLALRNSKANIDAVEIDPLVADIGVRLHPEKPYSNKRVNLVINDARNFIKETEKKIGYDFIQFVRLSCQFIFKRGRKT